ncbi:MAG: hypothetical protein WD404_08500 [Solirubrobacterales bacterium]
MPIWTQASFPQLMLLLHLFYWNSRPEPDPMRLPVSRLSTQIWSPESSRQLMPLFARYALNSLLEASFGSIEIDPIIRSYADANRPFWSAGNQ